MREDPLVHPEKWLRPDLVHPAPFLQCDSGLTPGGSGVLADPGRIDEEFRKAWLPYFCGWLPLLPEVSSLDGWGWREFKALPVSRFGGLARILSKVEDAGVWPEGLLDAFIALIR